MIAHADLAHLVAGGASHLAHLHLTPDALLAACVALAAIVAGAAVARFTADTGIARTRSTR